MRLTSIGAMVLLISVSGCGDSDVAFSDQTGAGGTGGATGGGGAGASGGATAGAGGVGGEGADGGGGGTAGSGGEPTCEELFMDIRAALGAAQTCDSSIDVPQCTDTVEGVCCREVVNPATGQAVDDYLALVKQASDAGCQRMCPEIPCNEMPQGTCVDAPNGDHCAVSD